MCLCAVYLREQPLRALTCLCLRPTGAECPQQGSGRVRNRPCSLQMQLGIDGVSPGEDTQHVLAAKLVVVRIIGAAALITLYWASRWADAVLMLVAGVPLSVIEILIVVGTVTQCYKTVRDPSVVFLNFNGDSRGAETNTVQEVFRPTPRSANSCRWSDLCKKYKS